MFCVPVMCLNQHEKLITGLLFYSQTYKDWLKRNPAEQKLPSFDLTPEQLFFVSFAQVIKPWRFMRLASDTLTVYKQCDITDKNM